MPTKELKLVDLVNDASVCWDYSFDKASGTLELSLDLDTVANNPTDATVTWVQNEDGEGVGTVSIEEEEVVEKKSVIEPILRQELSNYLVPALVDEVVYNLSDVIDIYEEKADIKPVEIR
tara:strand:- start:339 stop:698 length:360 start_codon:yes stop_codon:yes gene_type:complete